MKKYIVRLSAEERAELRQFVRIGQRSAQAITRARLLLLADEQGMARNDAEIAESLGISVHTVEVNRQRYCAQGLPAVLQRQIRKDKGRPVKLDGRVQAEVTRLACGTPPAGAAVWTLTLLADEPVRLEVVEDISRESVRQLLKKTSSSPT